MKIWSVNGFINVAFLLLIIAPVSFSQAKPAATPAQSPAAQAAWPLPEGYRVELRRGIDSSVGAVVRNDGFTINFDIGKMAGNYAMQYFPEHFERLRSRTHLNRDSIEREIKALQDQVQWRQRQRFNGEDLLVVMLKDNTLIASFANSYANFTAKADSGDKIADLLLIVTSYPRRPLVR